MDKLKASDKLAFPLDLDMATLLASVTQDNGHSKVGLRGNTELYERILCETVKHYGVFFSTCCLHPELSSSPSVFLQTVLDGDGNPIGVYELAGVLIHKGSNAHHGHYGEAA